VDVVQILGGLTDSQSLKRKEVALDSYLTDLSQTIRGIKAAIQEVNPRSQAGIEVEVGQLLLGHFPTLGRIANVKTQRADGVREIFTFLSVYGDLAGHLYHKTPVYIQILPDPDSGGQLSSKLVEAVVHCGTCDSIDSVFQEDGKTLVSFFVPEDVKGGCLLVVFGKRLADGATDFNQIPPARVVLIDCYDDEQPYKWSVLSDFQAPQVIAAERFWASESSSQLRKHFERTIGQIDRHEKVGGLLLSELATNAKLRGERFVKAAQAYLESDFNASETVTLLDLDVYAATMRNVGRYLRESVPLEPGESIEDLKKRITPGRISGVDEIMLPIKTLCDPIALLCQAAAGFGHDAASAGEMWMSSQVGVESKKVIVSHPHKTPETLRMICDSRYAPWAVTIDSDQELDRLVEAGLSKDTVIFIRFKATGASVVSNLSAKFGHPVSSDEDRVKIIELLKRVRDEGFKDFGWAFHVGTQSSQKDDYHHALKVALKLTRMAQEADKGLVVRNFNIGGGVCDERVALKDRTSGKRVLAGIGAEVTAFRGAVEKIIEERAWIVAEPGRVTCAAAGFMMSQVIAGADSGISGAVLRWAPTVQGILSGNVHDMAYYNLMPVHPQPGTLDIPYQVFGSSNRGNDRFPSIDPSGAHMLPSNLRSGDWLMSPEAGVAYGWNASGPIDGIDPGRLVAYYIEEGGKIQFFESPWSRRAGLSNRILKECVVTRGTSAVPPM
jgi:diaminopimelate decarboxylase